MPRFYEIIYIAGKYGLIYYDHDDCTYHIDMDIPSFPTREMADTMRQGLNARQEN